MRISDYAKVADWESRLADHGIAESERWTYMSVPDKSSLPILDSYIRQGMLP